MNLTQEYETLKHYEKRTGEKYPNNGMVWVKIRDIPDRPAWIPKAASDVWESDIAVIAYPPIPPSNKWRSE